MESCSIGPAIVPTNVGIFLDSHESDVTISHESLSCEMPFEADLTYGGRRHGFSWTQRV